MFQTHFHATKSLTSAHLAQTMTLLSLTVQELQQQVEAELASNPALELIEERRCPQCHRLLTSPGLCPICSRQLSTCPDEPIVFVSTREDLFTGGGLSPEDLPDDNLSASTEDLPTFVLRQIAPELSLQDRPLAAYILTHLDEDGLLTVTAQEIARYHHIPVSRVENIIRLIQRCEPIGVGSSCPQEAMLVQLEILAETRPIPEYARQTVTEGMDLLSRRQYSDLARKFKISLSQVQKIAKFIGENLNPFPARSYWGDIHQGNDSPSSGYHNPDIIISFLNDRPNNPLVVEIIMPFLGTLRVNPLFRQAIHQAAEAKIEEWKTDLERASLLVKCIQQRNHTMVRLLQRVVSIQQDFILHGATHLKPVTRASLAKELEVHESTISRAVSGKSLQLPNKRIIPLSEFFDRSLNVRSILRGMIELETRPLSDSDLVILLDKEGIKVARRTVAKYRAMEGILPAHLRQPYTRCEAYS
jgi:RNA polymerase sigma-54 factor